MKKKKGWKWGKKYDAAIGKKTTTTTKKQSGKIWMGGNGEKVT